MHIFVIETANVILQPCADNWPRERLSRLNNILIKSIVHYWEEDGKKLKPTSLKNYISWLQRAELKSIP